MLHEPYRSFWHFPSRSIKGRRCSRPVMLIFLRSADRGELEMASTSANGKRHKRFTHPVCFPIQELWRCELEAATVYMVFYKDHLAKWFKRIINFKIYTRNFLIGICFALPLFGQKIPSKDHVVLAAAAALVASCEHEPQLQPPIQHQNRTHFLLGL
jgi:hypothetical protein